MKTYWDHSEKERSELSEEQVRALLDYELMQQGVLRPVPPALEDETAPELTKRRLFGIECVGKYGSDEQQDVLFEAEAEATRFIDAHALLRVSDWETGATYAKRIADARITLVDVASEQDVLQHKAALIEARQRRERNSKARGEYDKALHAVEEASRSVWDDWLRCRGIADRNQRILDTFAEYKRLTEGNVDVARAFLGKAFAETEIEGAFAWFNAQV